MKEKLWKVNDIFPTHFHSGNIKQQESILLKKIIFTSIIIYLLLYIISGKMTKLNFTASDIN